MHDRASRIAKILLKITLFLAVLLGIGYALLPQPEKRPESPKNPLSLLLADDWDAAPHSVAEIQLPNDHGSHRHAGIEIWQLFGRFQTRIAQVFGFECTWIRVDLGGDPEQRNSAWASDQIFHLDYSVIPYDQGSIRRESASSRGALGLAGYDRTQRKLWLYRQALRFPEPGAAAASIELTIPDGEYPMRLRFFPKKALIDAPLDAPFRYYAMPRMKIFGTLKLAQNEQPVEGEAWFEHSWGKLPLGSGQLIRNRFLLQLSNGMEMNLWQSGRRDGSGRSLNSGFLVSTEGAARPLSAKQARVEAEGYWTSESSAIRYPLNWRLELPEQSMLLQIKPWREDQEATDFQTRWSGLVSISGHRGGDPLTGYGLLQLSGYAPHD